MKSAHVIVTFHGRIVDEQTLSLSVPVRIGECSDAVMGFPGHIAELSCLNDRVCVDGVAIGPHARTIWENDEVVVVVKECQIEPLSREPFWNTDVRLPIALFAAFLLVVSLQEFAWVVSKHVETSPISVAGWVIVPQASEAPPPKGNPGFDLEFVSRTCTYENVDSNLIVRCQQK